MSSTRQLFRKVGFVNNVSSTNQPAVNLVASPVLTSSYILTLPSAVPTATGQSLISDTSGNLSWGAASGVVSTFNATTNPVSTATNVTGLVFTTASTQLNVFVAVNATTNIYAVYQLFAYQKGSNSSWGLAYSINGDTDTDPNISFSITSTGQVQYVMGTVTGFSSLVVMWTLGTAVSNTLTSLSLSSSLNVGGLSTLIDTTGRSLTLANAAGTGSTNSTGGLFLNIAAQTWTDTATAASSTATNNFHASYLAVPTLAATNTSVVTPIASTLTISGPPTAGTNTTITNAYAMNVASGLSNFAGGMVANNLAFKGVGSGSNFSVAANGIIVFPAILYDRTSAYTISTGKWTIGQNGIYDVSISIYLTSSSTTAIQVYQNGTPVGNLCQIQSDTARFNIVGTNKFKFSKADIIWLMSTAAITIYAQDTGTSQMTCTLIS